MTTWPCRSRFAAVRLGHEPAEDAPGVGHEPMLERGADTASVHEALASARAGQGSIVVIEGPPGIGKSRLLAGAQASAREEQMDLLAASCSGREQAFDFRVALRLFEDRVARAEEDERRQLLSGPARLVVALLHEGPKATVAEGQPFLHGLYWLCRRLADRRPLAICVDDAHLADPSSLGFFLYLARRVQDLPIAVVLAVRSHRSGPGAELVEAIAACPAARTVRPAPLSAAAVARLLAGTLGRSIPEDVGRACFEVTGGNPFLVGELAKELPLPEIDSAPSSAAARVSELGPRSIADATAWDLAELGPWALGLARALAVLGDEAELPYAAALAGIDAGEAPRVARTLMEAAVVHLGERLTFAQPVVRRAMYLALAPAERSEAHRRAASILAGGVEALEQVAPHMLAATRPGDPVAVDPAAESKAQGRLTKGGLETPRERALATLEIARTLYARGRQEAAIEALERCAAGIEDDGLRARLEAASSVARDLGGLRPAAARPARPSREASGPAAPPSPAERLLLAQHASRRALRGDRCEEVAKLARQALGDGLLLDEETADGLGYYLATSALMLAEDLAGAEEALVAAIDDARRRASALGLATASYFHSFTALQSGRLSVAAQAARAALSGQSSGWRLAVPGAHALLAMTMIEQGSLDAATRELELASGGGEGPLARIPDCLHLAARARAKMLGGGDANEALAGYLECGRRLEAVGALNPAVVPWRSGAAGAAAQLGDRSEATRLAEEELHLALDFGAPGPIGRALHAQGLIEGGVEGIETLESAVQVLEGSQARLDRARAVIDFGAALRRSGKPRDARKPLRLGLDLATRCGAETLAERALEEAVAAGARPRRTATTGFGALTPRERQVVTLAAKGMSNREISGALFVTPKTVEWHLRHAYMKLEVSSRSDLTALVRPKLSVG